MNKKTQDKVYGKDSKPIKKFAKHEDVKKATEKAMIQFAGAIKRLADR